MMDRDPLEQWLWRPDRPAEQQDFQNVQRDLANLEQWLDQAQSTKRRAIPHIHGALWGGTAAIAPDDCERVQRLYLRVVQASGSGKSYVEEALLNLLAWTYRPTNIPFFFELLDLTPSRDRMIPRRRELALSALPLLAYRRDDPAALAALLAASAHPQPQVRALAIHYLRCIYTGINRLDPDDLPPLQVPDPAAGAGQDPFAWMGFEIEPGDDDPAAAADRDYRRGPRQLQMTYYSGS